MKTIILASGSPRRKELLEKIGLKFKVVKGDYQEDMDSHKTPEDLVTFLSFEKARAVAKTHKNSLVIGADTIVVCNGKVLGKPKNQEDAKGMLKTLSGKMHSVITGFTVIDTDTNKTISKSVETKVYFKKLDPEEIDAYVKTGEPMDKAGAYAIQGVGSAFIEKIEGDYGDGYWNFYCVRK